MAKVIAIPATLSLHTSASTLTQAKRRVAAYARVSTDHEDQLNSYKAQKKYYNDYIKTRLDWEYVDVYVSSNRDYGGDISMVATNTI